jgi:hypothetical protein
MKKMPQDQRREADVIAAVSSGSRSCALRTDSLAAWDGERAARRMGHVEAEGTNPRPTRKLRRAFSSLQWASFSHQTARPISGDDGFRFRKFLALPK